MIHEVIVGYVISACLAALILDLISEHKQTKKHKLNKKTDEKINEKTIETLDEIPKFKNLTQEQIDDIHSRGKITPEEKVKEWEGLGLCAPGDAIGSASWRCKKFHSNCHDCLVDYANEHDEYISLHSVMKGGSTNGN